MGGKSASAAAEKVDEARSRAQGARKRRFRLAGFGLLLALAGTGCLLIGSVFSCVGAGVVGAVSGLSGLRLRGRGLNAEPARDGAAPAKDEAAAARRVHEHAPVILYERSAEQPFWTRYLSRSFDDILQRERHSVLATPTSWLELVVQEDRDKLIQALGDAARSGGLLVEYRVRRGDGMVLWMRDQARLIAGDGHPPRLIGCLTDITGLRNRSAAAPTTGPAHLGESPSGRLAGTVGKTAPGSRAHFLLVFPGLNQRLGLERFLETHGCKATAAGSLSEISAALAAADGMTPLTHVLIDGTLAALVSRSLDCELQRASAAGIHVMSYAAGNATGMTGDGSPAPCIASLASPEDLERLLADFPPVEAAAGLSPAPAEPEEPLLDFERVREHANACRMQPAALLADLQRTFDADCAALGNALSLGEVTILRFRAHRAVTNAALAGNGSLATALKRILALAERGDLEQCRREFEAFDLLRRQLADACREGLPAQPTRRAIPSGGSPAS